MKTGLHLWWAILLLLAGGLLLAVVGCAADINPRPDVNTLWATSADADREARQYEARVYTDKDGHTLPYRLLKPLNYDPKAKYPLLLFLHGAGERGDDNLAQLRHLGPFARPAARAKHPCFILAPQCPRQGQWCDLGDGTRIRFSDTPTEPMRLAMETLDQVRKEFVVDPERLYVTGVSLGGFGTFDLLARRPGVFAAAVPVCGGGDPAQARALIGTPIWCFHGQADPIVPAEFSRRMILAIGEAGGRPQYTELRGQGHEIWTQVYSDPKLYEWLFAQRRHVPPSPTAGVAYK